MKTPRIINWSGLLLMSFTVFNLGEAQWSSDSSTNNPICTSTGEQTYLKMVSDGTGGALMVWQDARSGTNYDIYAQRVSGSGTVLWTANGVAACGDSHDQVFPSIASDGAGGAIVTWQDLRNGSDYDIYAQRLNSSGVAQWATNGVVVCDSTGNQQSPFIVSDGSGGAIITWLDGRTVSPGYYAQRINPSGVRQWTTYGVGVLLGASGISVSDVETDGSGGEVIFWLSTVTSPSVPYVARVTGSGSVLWNTSLASFYSQYTTAMAGDGAGGAYVVWSSPVSTSEYVFVQKVDSSGVIKWGPNGSCANTTNPQGISPAVTIDNNDGAIVAWTDVRNGNDDIYAQRMDSSAQWSANGVPICTLTSIQTLPFITSDGSGGAIIAWSDNRNGAGNDLYAQRVNASGVAQWRANGVAVCTATGDPQSVGMVPDGTGGSILSWVDYRNGNDHNIYASGISSGGVLPVEATDLAAVSNAGSVTVSWKTQTETDNEGFNVLRKGQESSSFTAVAGFATRADLRGAGTSTVPHSYSCTDNTIVSGETYSYRIQSVSTSGLVRVVGTVTLTTDIPGAYALEQNFPNPFNPTTTISFQLPAVSKVSLKIYDLLGREIQTLVNGEMNPGTHQVSFDASTLASGIYFYRLNAGMYTATRKLVLLK